MTEETFTIYQLDGPPLELGAHQIVWIDRSRMELLCPRKRYLGYDLHGTGYISPGRNEDLVIGGATHEGLDLLLQGGSLEKALKVAEEFYQKAPSHGDILMPEQQDVILKDGEHLSKAFIYGFYHTYLQELLDNFYVEAVEEEINWLMGTWGEGINMKYIVCMSRPDGVVRHRQSQRLWHVSHKTAASFTPQKHDTLEVDMQRFLESLSIWAKYGESPEGSLYNFFIKGEKRTDSEYSIYRSTSPLIRPYMQQRTPGGDILPEMFSYVYEWREIDKKSMTEKTRRLGKDFQRVSVYDVIDFNVWLEWLRHKMIPKGGDYLRESIVGLLPVYFDSEMTLEWLDEIRMDEEVWAITMDFVGSDALKSQLFRRELRKETSQCYSYGKRCPYYLNCWKGAPIETLIGIGSLEERTPNHLVEISGRYVNG